jgi:hypothetical protein
MDLLDLRAASTVMQYQVITTGHRENPFLNCWRAASGSINHFWNSPGLSCSVMLVSDLINPSGHD